MSTKQIEVYAPASIANMGPGFDVFGVALDEIGDTIALETIPEREIEVRVRGLEADSIPLEAEYNSAGAVLKHVMGLYGLDHGFFIDISKGVPPGKGLGSSGASAAATTHAVCRLLGLNISKDKRVGLAALGERAVSGSPHADNVSASLLGGFTIVGQDYDVVRLEPPEIELVVVIPEVEYRNKTRLARKLLPESVGFRDAVLNLTHASRMAAAVAIGDPVLFGKSISDHLVEPHRAEMIPNFWGVKRAALGSGAYGCSIAGGGPSLFAVGEDPEEIGRAMKEAFSDVGVGSEVLLTRPSRLGARVV